MRERETGRVGEGMLAAGEQPLQSQTVFSKSFPGAASLLVALIGALVLVGWMFDITMLKSVLPGLVTMKANTAIGMLLSGSALALLSLRKVSQPIRFWIAAMAAAVIAL